MEKPDQLQPLLTPIVQSMEDVTFDETSSNVPGKSLFENPSGSLNKDKGKEFEVVSKRKRNRKKGKNTDNSVPKVERQSRSYVVTDSDIKLYLSKHRVTDIMFKHYLQKRIGFECHKVKRRLSQVEVKKLFSPVRALCLELLSAVRQKKVFNNEKKIFITALNKSVSGSVRWADVVSGKKSIPPLEKDIALTAREDKIKRQSKRITELEQTLKKRDDQITTLSISIANLTERISVMEEKERSRSQQDPYADKKKLANKSSVFCHKCLPPTVYIYKRPLVTSNSVIHGADSKDCQNCGRRRVHLTAGTFVPAYDVSKTDRKDVYFYPEGNFVLDKYYEMEIKINDILSSNANGQENASRSGATFVGRVYPKNWDTPYSAIKKLRSIHKLLSVTTAADVRTEASTSSPRKRHRHAMIVEDDVYEEGELVDSYRPQYDN